MIYSGKNGWVASYKDAWNLNGTLSPIILSGLKRFKNLERMGVSNTLLESLEKEGKIVKPKDAGHHSEESLEIASAEWEKILDKMIYSFESNDEPKSTDYDFEIKTNSSHVNLKGMIETEFEIINEDAHNKYTNDLIKYRNEKNIGYELFGKYYSCLWD